MSFARRGRCVWACAEAALRTRTLATTGTISVYDRRGERLGTVYLGRMPEPGQPTLTRQLTDLIVAVLAAWEGPQPRLAYITDGGWHPTAYYAKVLRKLEMLQRPSKNDQRSRSDVKPDLVGFVQHTRQD